MFHTVTYTIILDLCFKISFPHFQRCFPVSAAREAPITYVTFGNLRTFSSEIEIHTPSNFIAQLDINRKPSSPSHPSTPKKWYI